ncbi:MAG: cell division protein FtsA [bacterium]|uniref:Cell division protein FtsA n=2 Tax=Bacteria candidate phyla TaxID=1783234 RepID=A0A101I347_UNCT6|nr:MAG: Cell division protein ftsA [candidate division TA06 bacterium 32_111]KUK87903.1 MAG: Cell division protein ftsA [candidate division TA06 bacterium 34_109]MDI6700568.1 cell division protein FtsA [bacterium]HAF08056.1 cell division protein FtsA [candidate division WOR-3 bacterium]HCP16243.1 cell division protein FtsA [candidate division WOR-3 bacterium]
MVITVLDIGTSTIKTLIASLEEENTINLRGVGESSKHKMFKSKITDVESTVAAIKDSMLKAEVMAGIRPDNLFASIGGVETKGITGKGTIALPKQNSIITENDVLRAINQSKVMSIGDNPILHVIERNFTVDTQENIKNPVGLIGSKLLCETMVITIPSLIIQNYSNVIERAGYRVEDYVSQHIAASYSILSEEEKELGVALIDIGGGTTKITVFTDSVIREIDTIEIGGANITKDISIGLRLTNNDSENLKKKYGSCIKDNLNADEKFKVKGLTDNEEREISTVELYEIIAPRVDELIEFIQQSLASSQLFDKLNAGIVLTGGTANLKGIKDRFERKMNIPTKIGYPKLNVGMSEQIKDPSFSVACGILEYVTPKFLNKNYSRKKKMDISGFFSKTFETIKDLFKL